MHRDFRCVVAVRDGKFETSPFQAHSSRGRVNVGLWASWMRPTADIDRVNRQLAELAKETAGVLVHASPSILEAIDAGLIPVACWSHASTRGLYVAILPSAFNRTIRKGVSAEEIHSEMFALARD